MKTLKIIAPLFFGMLIACTTSPDKKEHKLPKDSLKTNEKIVPRTKNSADTTIDVAGVSLIPLLPNSQLKGIKLKLETSQTKKLKAGKQRFQFHLKTPDVLDKSDLKIGLLINNQLVGVKNAAKAIFQPELLEGNNVVLAFVLDKNGNSVKQTGAYLLKNFYIGKGKSSFDIQQAQLYYLQPTASQQNINPDQVVLDFYLLNTSLDINKHLLKLTLDTTVTFLKNWEAYKIEGLKRGAHAFRLQLVDADKKVVAGPFNDSGVRKFTID